MSGNIDIIKLIIDGNKIRTVFQPIIKLKNGSVYGYEALSRTTLKECRYNIEELFGIARATKQVWEFETCCRKAALKNAVNKPVDTKLFLNVDPGIIHDPLMRSGFTCKALKKYGLKPDDIVIEITEKSAVKDMCLFTDAINHYKKQNFQIAVDDVGSGYSGMNRICHVSPGFIKLDIQFVKNIDKDEIRKSAVKSIVQFCRDEEIKVIAEGIETKEELETLIFLGVKYGQGYYLAKPDTNFVVTRDSLKYEIERYNTSLKYGLQSTIFDVIGTICHVDTVVECNDMAVDVYNMMHDIQEINDVYVVDTDRNVQGLLTRSYLCEKFSGQYGYNLNRKKVVSEIMLNDFLEVDDDMRIDEVAKAAINRPVQTEYDAVVVTRQHKYLGVVTVKELLNTAIDIQVKRATDANPLTGLPGNNLVQSEMQTAIENNIAFEVAYLDLDNFKAYNDAYGFSNGDCMIKVLAECIVKNSSDVDFTGHIGGDDFVIISYDDKLIGKCNNIIEMFKETVCNLYNTMDLKNGYIKSKNRNGFEENFPIATLSIAIVSSQRNNVKDMVELSELIAHTKKKAKRISGNSIEII